MKLWQRGPRAHQGLEFKRAESYIHLLSCYSILEITVLCLSLFQLSCLLGQACSSYLYHT